MNVLRIARRGTAEFWLGLCDVRLCHFSLIRPHDEASGSDIGERDRFGRTSHAWRRDSRLCPLSGLPLARHHSTFARIMKTIAFFIFANSSLFAGELRVTLPNDEAGSAMVERISDAEYIEKPEQQIQQEGQIAVLEFKNLQAGKYRVSYISSLDPLAYLTTIMETHIEVHEKSKDSVILFAPFVKQGAELPKDVEAFLMNHRENYLTLNVTYDNSKKPFELTRGRWFDICPLRSEGEYHIQVWNHSYKEIPKVRKVIFEKTFRPASRPEPFSKSDDLQKIKESEQD